MANTLGSLVVSLGLDAAEFTRGLSKSEYQAQQFSRQISNEFAAGVVKAAAAIKAFETVIIDAGYALTVGIPGAVAEYQDLADKMGDSAEQIASLKLASDLSGVSLDTLSAASVKLTASLAKTDDESKGVGAGLKAIGIEMEAFKGLSPVEQIDAVSKALAGFEDGSGKTAAAVAIFGKSGAELLPLLNDLAEEGGRQVRLTGEQIKAADDYDKSLARLRSEMQTLLQVTAADAAPVMTQMVGLLRETMAYSQDAAGGVNLLTGAMGGVRVALQTVLGVGSDVAFVFKTLGDTAGAYAAVSAALIGGDIAGAKAIGAAYRELSAQRRQELDLYQASIMLPDSVRWTPDEARKRGRNGQLGGRPSISTSGLQTGGDKNKKSKEKKDAAYTGLSYDEQITQRVGKLLEDSDLTKAKEYADTLARLDELYFTGAIQSDLYDSALKKLTATKSLAGDASKELAEKERRAQDDMKRFNALIDAGAGRKAEALRQDLALLQKYAALADAPEIKDAIAVIEKQMNPGIETAEERVKRLGDAFASTFDRAFTDGMELGDLLKKLAWDAINIQFLTPATQKAGNWLGTALSGLFSFDGGGYTGSGSRAGGLDGKGGFLAVMHPDETVLDHTRGQGLVGGGGSSVNVSYSIDARGADPGVEQRLRTALAESEARLRATIVPTVMQASRRSTGVARALRGG